MVEPAQRQRPSPGDILRPGWFDRAEALDDVLDSAARPVTEDTWGTGAAAEEAHRAMMELTGGPAPLRSDLPD